jgi:hypothetical protein
VRACLVPNVASDHAETRDTRHETDSSRAGSKWWGVQHGMSTDSFQKLGGRCVGAVNESSQRGVDAFAGRSDCAIWRCLAWGSSKLPVRASGGLHTANSPPRQAGTLGDYTLPYCRNY